MSLASRPRPLLGLAVAAGLVTAACSGGDPATSSSPSSGPTEIDVAATASLPPAEFATTLDDDVFVVNVHVPDEGSIAGTDASVPYDEIRTRIAELPEDRGAALAVYCKTGRMSAEASATLQGLGYTDVVELRGGMDAWVADGRELLPAVG